MKREIKFRAWIPALGIMLYGITVYQDGMIGLSSDDFEAAVKKANPLFKIMDDEVILDDEENEKFDRVMGILPGDDWYWIEEDECEILEYSGINLNHSEIYEGDVCSNEVAKWEVIFNRGCFCGRMIGGKNIETHLALRGIIGLRLIGNIYENSELLSGTITTFDLKEIDRANDEK